MTNAEYIARYLQSRGVTHVHELIGGMITFLLDALHNCTDIKVVSMHHEQGAAFAAEGWARMKGTPGVAMATSGPGATNLLTGIGSCYFDSVPAVFITGQVNRHEQKGDKAIRQLGFQETDIVSMVRPITKAAWLVNRPEELPAILNEAFRVACSGRPGPVLIDVPMDVQRFVLPAGTGIPEIVGPDLAKPDVSGRGIFLQKLRKALGESARPIILAGGGIRSAGALDAFRAVVKQLQIPVVNSLMGVDLLPASDPLRFGLIGSYGNRWANLGFGRSDLVIVLGSRLDIRQTGSDVAGFSAGRTFFHIDCEPGETNNRVLGCEVWHEELKPFLEAALKYLPVIATPRPAWLMELERLRKEWPDVKELAGASGINPNDFMHALSRHSASAAAYVCDVGQHQMWAAQSLDLLSTQRFLTSGGMGSMGFALPAAIGACLASQSPVVVVAGDGGFQCNLQELQTVVRNHLPLKMVVFNNHCHGMVRQFQESYFKGRYQSTVWGYDTPDFAKVARAYGIPSCQISEPVEIETALAAMFADVTEPYLLEVGIDMMTNAYPKLAFGRTFGEMEPGAKPLEMEGT
jgi:acetolactate synthase-1/2/3 large subunit